MTTAIARDPSPNTPRFGRSDAMRSKHTVEGYFNNNGQGYRQPTVIEIPSQNIRVELYYNQLKQPKLQLIQQDILSSSSQFFKELSDSTAADQSKTSPAIFKLYLFNNQEDYQHLGGKKFSWDLGSEGGKAFYRGRPGVHSELYLYQQGDALNLKHELVHALTFYATQGNYQSIPKFMIEGIAEYFEHQQGVVQVKPADYADVSFDALKGLSYSKNPQENERLYRMGHALVSYLQDQHPTVLSKYLNDLYRNDPVSAERKLQLALGQAEALKQWLSEHSLEQLFQKANLLQAKPDSFIGTQTVLVGNQRKTMRYHQAMIMTQDQQTVGRFSPILHLWRGNSVRAINRATNELLEIPAEYHFVKVFTTPQGDPQLLYCDDKGKLYTESQDYQDQVLNKLYDRIPALQDLRQAAASERLAAADHYLQLNKAFEQVRADFREGAISYALMVKRHEEIKASRAIITQIDEKIVQFKTDLYTSLFTESGAEALARIKNSPTHYNAYQQSLPLVAALKALLPIAQNQLGGIKKSQLQRWAANNKVLALKILGQGDRSALSIYNGARKVGELTTETGFFQSIEADSPADTANYPQEFVYEDILQGLNVRYRDPYLAVTEKDNGYQLSFIEDKSIKGDHHFAEPHFHQNELLKLGIQHIYTEELQPLLLNGKILNHADSPQAQHTETQRRSGIIVEKGGVLDAKGTDRTDDDTHAAVVKQGDQRLHHFTNTGFYITEAIKNSQGEIINPSSLFIHDHGRNRRWQLPTAITHLQLVKDEAGERKLVPCDANGNQFPDGMPDLPEAYRFIDLLFAHQYAKQDYSSQQVNIGLVNFDVYPEGTRFAIKYDPQDQAIRRDEQGNIVRRYEGDAYFTQVKLWQGDQEIGMLPNSFHNFRGEIFFSADLNYSYSDFLASISPQVEVEEIPGGGKKISFNRGAGDLAGTDRGYTDHQRIFVPKTTSTPQPKQLVAGMAALNQEEAGVETQSVERSLSRSSSFGNRVVRAG